MNNSIVVRCEPSLGLSYRLSVFFLNFRNTCAAADDVEVVSAIVKFSLRSPVFM